MCHRFGQLVLMQFGQIQFGVKMHRVYVALVGVNGFGSGIIPSLVKPQHRRQHRLDPLADVQHFARCTGQGAFGVIQRGRIQRADPLDFDCLG